MIFSRFDKINNCFSIAGKQKRLKQAKEEAQDEIEKYRQERERQFKEFEAKVNLSVISESSKKNSFIDVIGYAILIVSEKSHDVIKHRELRIKSFNGFVDASRDALYILMQDRKFSYPMKVTFGCELQRNPF